MKLVIRRIIENWLKEHNQVRNIFEKHARMNKCVMMEGIVNESKLAETEIERHCMVLRWHGYFISPLPSTYCSKKAIKKIWECF